MDKINNIFKKIFKIIFYTLSLGIFKDAYYEFKSNQRKLKMADGKIENFTLKLEDDDKYFLIDRATEGIVYHAISNIEFNQMNSILKEGIDLNDINLYPDILKRIESLGSFLRHNQKLELEHYKFLHKDLKVKLILIERSDPLKFSIYDENDIEDSEFEIDKNGNYNLKILRGPSKNVEIKRWLHLKLESGSFIHYIPLTDVTVTNPLIISYYMICAYVKYKEIFKRKLWFYSIDLYSKLLDRNKIIIDKGLDKNKSDNNYNANEEISCNRFLQLRKDFIMKIKEDKRFHMSEIRTNRKNYKRND